MGRLRKGVIALLAALAMVTSVPLVSAFAVSESSGAGSDGSGVTVGKTASELENDTTTVTLKVGATQEKTVSDVVFVLDKSASSEIRQEAMKMLDELVEQSKEGNVIKVGIVNFESLELDDWGCGLTPLTDENRETIEQAIQYKEKDSSGTNIHAGLVAGEKMLKADTEVDDANKHLVLVTDGVAYLWGTAEDGGPFSIYSESISNGEENLYASHETIDWHHENAASKYYDEFSDMVTWMSSHGDSIKSDIETYGIKYEEGQYQASDYEVMHGQGEDTDWSVIDKFKSENSYVPYEDLTQTASAPDAAIYMAANEWQAIAEEYQAYAYHDPRYSKNGKYVWAANAISNLSDLGGYSAELPEDAADYDGMFDAVKSSVLYEIQSGTVTDVIGNDFDLDSLSSFKLKVGETELEGEVDEEKQTVTFGDKDEYVVTYYNRGTDSDSREQFSWAINTPVEQGKGLELSYELKLANKETEPGKYEVPTNEEATLDYTSTVGDGGTVEFPEPEVSYTVYESGEIVGNDGVTVDKVADPTDLTNTDETTVTLSVGSTEETTAADVVFVLDKSTSDNVKNQALALLNELMDHTEQSNLKVNVGVVTFNRVANNEGFNLGLTELSEESYESISKIFNKELKDGSNLEAGIRAGKEMLDDGDSVLPENKHLVLVSDGIAYMWGVGENPRTMYVELNNTRAAGVDLVNDYYAYRSHDWDAYLNAAQWLKDAEEGGIEDEINDCEVDYTSGTDNDVMPYVPAGDDHPYTSLEGALYKAGQAWQEAADDGYQLYAFASTERASTYPWGPNFVGGLGTIGGVSTTYSDTETGVDGIFDGVKNSVIYELEEGVITDVIGEDFDLTSLDSFSLTVGSTTYKGVVDETVGTVSFDNGNYIVTYYPDTDATHNEHFTLEINVPVMSDAGLSISYGLTLVNRETEPGRYEKIPTNESAVLKYESTDGEEKEKPFPRPEVWYEVDLEAWIRPADITVYMGGEEGQGYEGVITGTDTDGDDDSDGDYVQENSLPNPGFYFDLPNEVNKALLAAEVADDDNELLSVDLSRYLAIEGPNSQKWTVEAYGESSSVLDGKHLYRIVPKDDNTHPLRLQFEDADGNIQTSDQFDPTQALYQTYKMLIYTGDLDRDAITLKVTIPGKDGAEDQVFNCKLAVPDEQTEGTLTIRYVTGDQDQVVTDVMDSEDAVLTEAAEAGNADKAYAVIDGDVTYRVNDSTVDVSDPQNVGPSLLFDEVVSDESVTDVQGMDSYDEQLRDEALAVLGDRGVNLSNVDFEAKYLDLVDAHNGNAWLTAVDENGDSKDVTVYWPYPDGTDEDTAFYLVHFEGLDRELQNSEIAGAIQDADTEVIELGEPTDHGIKFTTDSFSPFVLVWGTSDSDPDNPPVNPPHEEDPDPSDPSDPTDSDTDVSKKLDGRDLKAGEFSFVISTAKDYGSAVSPARLTATNAADGSVNFAGGFTFSKAGTYDFVISEVLPTDDDPEADGVQSDGVTYDESTHRATAKVTEVDGKLQVSWTVDDAITFTNDYEEPGEPDTPAEPEEPTTPEEPDQPAKPEEPEEGLPSTGDAAPAAIAAVAGIGLACIAGAVALRKRGEK